MSSLVLLFFALTSYFFLAYRTRDFLSPSAFLCLFWFGSASLADVASLKNPSLQPPWELETYAALYLSGLSMFVPGLLQRRQPFVQTIQCEPSAIFRNITTAFMWLSIVAVVSRLYVFGYSPERLILDFGGADLKSIAPDDAIPGLFYCELFTPFLCLAAIFELKASSRATKLRRIGLTSYVLYSVFVYCLLIAVSRGTLLVIVTGALYLYAQTARFRLVHLILGVALTTAALTALSYLRMSSETLTNSMLGDNLLLRFLSPIYTYVSFNFDNLNALIRASHDFTFVSYSLKFLIWPFFKSDYESGRILLTNYDTLFFNARTFLYPFYHDLGLIGCALYPGLISLFVTLLRNSIPRYPARIMTMMGLQKSIWFTFFGNYFFGELSIFIPLLLLGILSAIYPLMRLPINAS
jgi:oligosaccharide repeat unit polymerase